MKKQILKPMKAKDLEKVLNGESKYIFMNKLPKELKSGSIVNLYCTKGKPLLVELIYKEDGERYNNGNQYLTDNDKTIQEVGDLLNGKVTCSFEVGQIHTVAFNGYGTELVDISKEDLPAIIDTVTAENQGYTSQPYAIEITNLNIEPRELGEFISAKTGNIITKSPRSFMWVVER